MQPVCIQSSCWPTPTCLILQPTPTPPHTPQGLYEDPTILFTGEPELVELKLVEGEPLLVVQFACQQLKCTRDKFGNVVEGDTNTIQKARENVT